MIWSITSLFKLRVHHKLAEVIFLTLVLLLCIFELNRRAQGDSNTLLTKKYGKKIILSWNGFFHFTSFMVPDLEQLQCPVKDCVVTADRGLLDISDALVFHWFEARANDIPPRKQRHQRWVLMTFEPPMHAPKGVLESPSSWIDWTATYRLDSDIPATYGRVDPRPSEIQNQFPPVPDYENLARRHSVAWMNSHCSTYSCREELVAELSRFIRIDVYGECNGNLSLRQISTQEAFSILAKRYVFYLSFENSICKDYATEKVFLPLYYGLIPVVYGGANYEQQLPPGSYVNVLNFDSAEELAQHLHSVQRNWTLYSSYFSWRQMYYLPLGDCNNMFFCGICEKLHSGRQDLESASKTRNLTTWWSEDQDCAHPGSGLLTKSVKFLRSRVRNWYQ